MALTIRIIAVPEQGVVFEEGSTTEAARAAMQSEVKRFGLEVPPGLGWEVSDWDIYELELTLADYTQAATQEEDGNSRLTFGRHVDTGDSGYWPPDEVE